MRHVTRCVFPRICRIFAECHCLSVAGGPGGGHKVIIPPQTDQMSPALGSHVRKQRRDNVHQYWEFQVHMSMRDPPAYRGDSWPS